MYIYIMERVSQREWSTILWGKREIKIGISKNALQRKRQVDSGIPGKVILRKYYKVRNARKLETKLHRLFKQSNFIPNGAKEGSGKTEFFKLSPYQLRKLKSMLKKKAQKDSLIAFFYVPIHFKIIFASVFIVLFLHYLKSI